MDKYKTLPKTNPEKKAERKSVFKGRIDRAYPEQDCLDQNIIEVLCNAMHILNDIFIGERHKGLEKKELMFSVVYPKFSKKFDTDTFGRYIEDLLSLSKNSVKPSSPWQRFVKILKKGLASWLFKRV